MPPILRCKLCNKPFDREATLKRHGYYCRSRKASPAVRARSCTNCAESKARCDNSRPECSRCVMKSVACRYPVRRKSPATTKPSSGDQLGPSLQLSSTELSAWNFEEAIEDHTTNPVDERVWNDSHLQRDLLIGEEMNDLLAFSATIPPGSVLPQKASMPQSIAINVRSLAPRFKSDAGSQMAAKLLLSNLQSYPVMILRQSSIPPFIHPSLLSSARVNSDMEPLHVCINLMHMISKGLPGGRKLFWSNVRLECGRMCEEYAAFNKWERLAAMQALAIYLLVRLCEGETEHNDFEPLLLGTITLLARQTNYSDAHNSKQTLYHAKLDASWREWLYEESVRRICVVYQAVNMLVHFEPAMLCDLQTNLILAPLPSRKQLWEAKNEHVWTVEQEKEAGLPAVFGLATNGQLVNLAKGAMSCSEARGLYNVWDEQAHATDWGEWCSEMDGLGGLVMLAAASVAS